ncbi:GAF domain-containing protein [Cohnella herbarum]|uniref:GAF domain-containing protein n=1 Tax=Cohnella herbarum TaxID=2728023 RepID=A0A7Z2ZRF6_9BACL|nr:GAF domain-containing protein [Cohnella herbarum]QJD88012.1 GAF domain-containing protein [Cohnella herbarum]
MFQKESYTGTKQQNYQLVTQQLSSLLEGETDRIANLSNASALLNLFLTDVNWVGFYLLKSGELVLGPFQGMPACIRIPIGKGVCGTAAQKRETIRVDDVHLFPGHIACDEASQSEIVIPLIKDDELIGVLDIDSPSKGRFDGIDQDCLERLVKNLVKYI